MIEFLKPMDTTVQDIIDSPKWDTKGLSPDTSTRLIELKAMFINVHKRINAILTLEDKSAQEHMLDIEQVMFDDDCLSE